MVKAPSSSKAPIKVGILTGSPSDLNVVRKAQEVLEQLGVECEIKVLSAHRTPERVQAYVDGKELRKTVVVPGRLVSLVV